MHICTEYIYLLLMLRGVKVIRFKVKEIYDFLILFFFQIHFTLQLFPTLISQSNKLSNSLPISEGPVICVRLSYRYECFVHYIDSSIPFQMLYVTVTYLKLYLNRKFVCFWKKYIYENIWNTKMFINERSDHVYMSVYNLYII
jgi:hypothetical protein